MWHEIHKSNYVARESHDKPYTTVATMKLAKLKYRQIHFLEKTPNISPVKISIYTVVGIDFLIYMCDHT